MNAKHQAPTSKHQRRSKPQTAERANARSATLKYPTVADDVLVLNETADANGASKHPFDLEERTARFGEAIVRFSKAIPRDPTNDRLINWLDAQRVLAETTAKPTRGFRKRIFVT